KAESLRCFGDMYSGEKLRDEVFGLLEEVAAIAHFPEIAGSAFSEDAADVAFAGIVGGQREVPVAEHLVQILQIARRSVRRLDRIAALVDVAVNAQAIAASGTRNELPRPDGTRTRYRVGAKAAFDQGQVRQL